MITIATFCEVDIKVQHPNCSEKALSVQKTSVGWKTAKGSLGKKKVCHVTLNLIKNINRKPNEIYDYRFSRLFSNFPKLSKTSISNLFPIL